MKARIICAVSAVISLALAGGILALVWFESGVIAISATAAAIAASLPVCAALHELGHALFGLCSGVRARLSAKSFISFFSPSCCKIVPHTCKRIKSKLCATVCGGLIINLIFIIFGVVALAVPKIPSYLSALTPASLYLFLINLAPAEYAGGKTDGLTLAEILRGEPSAKVMLAIVEVQGQVNCGTPLAEVDEKLLFDLPQLPEDDINFIALTDLRREYYKARGDDELAAKYAARFEELKQYLPEGYL